MEETNNRTGRGGSEGGADCWSLVEVSVAGCLEIAGFASLRCGALDGWAQRRTPCCGHQGGPRGSPVFAAVCTTEPGVRTTAPGPASARPPELPDFPGVEGWEVMWYRRVGKEVI